MYTDLFMMYIQEVHIVPKRTTSPVLEFLNNPWGLGTE